MWCTKTWNNFRPFGYHIPIGVSAQKCGAQCYEFLAQKCLMFIDLVVKKVHNVAKLEGGKRCQVFMNLVVKRAQC